MVQRQPGAYNPATAAGSRGIAMPTTRLRRISSRCRRGALASAALTAVVAAVTSVAGSDAMPPAGWTNDLTPIAATDWNYERAAHLLGRAGFGGTPEEIGRLAVM